MKLFMTKTVGEGGYIGEHDGVKWSIYPGRASEIPDEAAKKLLADYAGEFVVLGENQDSISDSVAASKDAEIRDLKAQLEKLQAGKKAK